MLSPIPSPVAAAARAAADAARAAFLAGCADPASAGALWLADGAARRARLTVISAARRAV
jgi:hypothetical protein